MISKSREETEVSMRLEERTLEAGIRRLGWPSQVFPLLCHSERSDEPLARGNHHRPGKEFATQPTRGPILSVSFALGSGF